MSIEVVDSVISHTAMFVAPISKGKPWTTRLVSGAWHMTLKLDAKKENVEVEEEIPYET